MNYRKNSKWLFTDYDLISAVQDTAEEITEVVINKILENTRVSVLHNLYHHANAVRYYQIVHYNPNNGDDSFLYVVNNGEEFDICSRLHIEKPEYVTYYRMIKSDFIQLCKDNGVEI